MTRTAPHLRLYALTVFECAEPLPADRWWVITAWPPTGVSWPEPAIAAADRSLREELTRAGAAPFRVTGGSPDGRHREPGWGAVLPEPDALRIGRAYRQIAIFRIDRGRMCIVDCDTGTPYPVDRPFTLR